MEQKRNKSGFWRVLGPLLLFWIIQWIGSAILSSVVSVAYAWPGLSDIVERYGSAGTLSSAQMDSIRTEIQTLMNAILPEAAGFILQHSAEFTALLGLLTLPFMLLFFVRDRKRDRRLNRIVNKKAPAWKYVFLVGLGGTACIALNNLESMSMLAFDLTNTYAGTAERFYSASFPTQLLCLGIISPVVEEILYRGVLFSRYREGASFGMAALYSSLLFSISHTNMVQMIFAFAVGLLMSYAYEKYGSVKAPLCLHMMINITSLTVTWLDGFTWMFSDAMRLAVVTVGCAFAASVMFVLIQRIEEKPEPASTKKGVEDRDDQIKI